MDRRPFGIILSHAIFYNSASNNKLIEDYEVGTRKTVEHEKNSLIFFLNFLVAKKQHMSFYLVLPFCFHVSSVVTRARIHTHIHTLVKSLKRGQ